jgi:hypothetical protein
MKIISITVTVRSAVLCMGTMGSCPVVPQENEPHELVNNYIAFILEILSLINNNRYTYSMNGIINS